MKRSTTSKPGHARQRWGGVFSRSKGQAGLFYVRGTRGRCADLEYHHRIEELLLAHNVPNQRRMTRGAWDGWDLAGFAFLDGGYSAVTGGGGMGYGGAYVVGFAAFRFLCGKLDLVPPRALKGESRPTATIAQLEVALETQLEDDLETLHLESRARRLCGIRDYDVLRATTRAFLDDEWSTLDLRGSSERAEKPQAVKKEKPDPATDRAGKGDKPGDPLAGRSGNVQRMVAGLSDAELDRYLEYWSVRHDEYAKTGDGYSAWWCTKQSSIGLSVKRVRAERRK